ESEVGWFGPAPVVTAPSDRVTKRQAFFETKMPEMSYEETPKSSRVHGPYCRRFDGSRMCAMARPRGLRGPGVRAPSRRLQRKSLHRRSADAAAGGSLCRKDRAFHGSRIERRD